ncbi:MAG: 23S rRNA (uracil(1939)-C(5))-methyltransferase RlmD, partial [Firmicutes bacterium]|nr:23S rRNA (uracil(1939)-C(5))-methyltransferase RlmD [Bacillota bacterium]
MSKEKKIPPLKKNDIITLNITDLGAKGEGIGHVESYAVFVPGALPKERVTVKILKALPSFAYGKLMELISPCAERVTPACSHYKSCGGCSLMHLSYEAQLAYKQKRITDCLERIGGVHFPGRIPVLGMESPYRYRSKALLPIRMEKNNRMEKDKLQIGFFAPASHRVVDIDSCMIQHPLVDTIISRLRTFILSNNISIYDEDEHKGLLRHVQVRVSHSTGEALVTLVINGKRLPESEKLIESLKSVPGVAGISLSINTQRTNVPMSKNMVYLWGKRYVTEKLGEIEYRISPLSFFQVNPAQAELICREAVRMAKLSPEDSVLELYCGIGTLSLYFAKEAKRVLGIEIVGAAVADAKKNAEQNGIKNAEFILSSAEEADSFLKERNFVPDVIVVDPPRKGCSESVLKIISEIAPERLIYVSCNPATLARDIKILAQSGYELRDAAGVDQFCMSPHIETVCLLS